MKEHMDSMLRQNSVMDADLLTLGDVPLDNDDIISGSPRVSFSEVINTPILEVGVWQLTAGTVTDTEVDEIFVILSGSATLEFDGSDEVHHLRPGVIGRLAAGARTRWTVTETLRKVYFMAPTSDQQTSA
jgi:uncharacterized cupin superfamily protein